MKKSDDNEELKKYFLFAIVFLLIFLSFKIIQPYLIIIISAFILSYLVLPLFKRLNKKLPESLSAMICILLIFLVILVPLGGVIGGIVNQANSIMSNGGFIGLVENLESSTFLEDWGIDISNLFEKGTLLTVSLVSSALSYLPSLIISLIVLLFGIFYILISWDDLSRELKAYLPFQEKNKIAKEIDVSTKGIIYGSLLIAIIEFAIAAIGFYISGVNPYLLLSIIIFFFAFIPGLGPTIVWVPMAIYFLVMKDYTTLTGVVITGLILSTGVDAILRAKVLGKKSQINPFIMLIGILGGISFFGIFGFVIGPLILIYSLKILREALK